VQLESLLNHKYRFIEAEDEVFKVYGIAERWYFLKCILDDPKFKMMHPMLGNK